LKKFNCAQLPYLVVNRIRYSIVDIAAGNLHQFSLAVYIFYLLIWPTLTKNDREAFALFRTLFVRAAIKIRGAVCHQILLPWMKTVANINSVAKYKAEHQQLVSKLTRMKSQPNLLFDGYKLICDNLHPLLATLLLNDLKISSCLRLIKAGSLGLLCLTVPSVVKKRLLQDHCMLKSLTLSMK
jgi:hypothetical protein